MSSPRVHLANEMSLYFENQRGNSQQPAFRQRNSGNRSWYTSFSICECRTYILLVLQGIQHHLIIHATRIQGKDTQ